MVSALRWAVKKAGSNRLKAPKIKGKTQP